MTNSDIEHMAQGYPLSHIGKDHEEVVIELAANVIELQQKLDAMADKLARSEDWSAGVDHERMEYIEKCNALAAENAALKESVEHAAGCIHAAEVEGLQDALESQDGERLSDLVHRRLCHAYLPTETPATDAYLNSVRAEGAREVASALGKIPKREMNISGQRHYYIQRSEAILTAEDISEQLRSGTHDTADKAG